MESTPALSSRHSLSSSISISWTVSTTPAYLRFVSAERKGSMVALSSSMTRCNAQSIHSVCAPLPLSLHRRRQWAANAKKRRAQRGGISTLRQVTTHSSLCWLFSTIFNNLATRQRCNGTPSETAATGSILGVSSLDSSNLAPLTHLSKLCCLSMYSSVQPYCHTAIMHAGARSRSRNYACARCGPAA